MDVSLSSELEQFVREQIDRGNHASVDEVVQEGLRLLRNRERTRERLRQEITVGLEQLERGEFDEYDDESLTELFEALKTGARKQLADQPASKRL